MKEQKIFIYADAYATRTLLYHVDYLLQLPIVEVFILRENHDNGENFPFNNNMFVRYCNTIEEGIINSDLVIMVEDKKMPRKKVQIFTEFAEAYNKKKIIIKNPWELERGGPLLEKTKATPCKTVKPVVLTLSVGRLSQCYCVELLLNKIFVENAISFHQEFSEETMMLLQQIMNYTDVLPEGPFRTINNERDADIIIKTVAMESLQQLEQKEMDEWFSELRPDVVIISCMMDYDYDLQSNINDILWYKYGINIALTIASPYILFEKYENEYVAIYCNDEATNKEERLYLNKDIQDIIETNIFSRILKLNEISIIN